MVATHSEEQPECLARSKDVYASTTDVRDVKYSPHPPSSDKFNQHDVNRSRHRIYTNAQSYFASAFAIGGVKLDI